MNEFLRLRIELDRAITYGMIDQARVLAEEGGVKAQAAGSAGEIAYFTAQGYIIREDFSGALPYLEEAIRHNPHDGAAFNDKALCLSELGKIDAALDYFDLGISVEPDYATIYHNKGWLLNKTGHADEAVIYFERALSLEPDRAVTYENLGDAYRNLGQADSARAAYQKALAFLPAGCEEIKAQLEKLV